MARTSSSSLRTFTWMPVCSLEGRDEGVGGLDVLAVVEGDRGSRRRGAAAAGGEKTGGQQADERHDRFRVGSFSSCLRSAPAGAVASVGPAFVGTNIRVPEDLSSRGPILRDFGRDQHCLR